MSTELVKFTPLKRELKLRKGATVVVDGHNTPKYFVFDVRTFIKTLTRLDEVFEKSRIFDNPAGRLIDEIEERLPIKASYWTKLAS